MKTCFLSWTDVNMLGAALRERCIKAHPEVNAPRIYGVPRGGVYAAMLTGLPIAEDPRTADVIVDDLVDSGNTRVKWVTETGKPFEVLFHKESPDQWVVFPWEAAVGETGPEDAVVRLLQFIGEDPKREGLVETPKRVLKAWTELTEGYKVSVSEVLAKDFESDGYDEMVVLRGIPFHSTCEHHLLPFYGVASVGYIPGKRVVGLSKLARLVDAFARRLQIQERLTKQVVEALVSHLSPLGAGCVIRATHSCMSCRGVKKPGAEMVTASLWGAFKETPEARAEFLDHCRQGG